MLNLMNGPNYNKISPLYTYGWCTTLGSLLLFFWFWSFSSDLCLIFNLYRCKFHTLFIFSTMWNFLMCLQVTAKRTNVPGMKLYRARRPNPNMRSRSPFIPAPFVFSPYGYGYASWWLPPLGRVLPLPMFS